MSLTHATEAASAEAAVLAGDASQIHEAGALIVLTAPLTEIIDHAG